MNNRIIAGLLALGFIVGAIAVYPIARASQPVKTVTKTQTKQVVTKIENGMTIQKLLPLLGQPAAETTKPSAKNNGVECVAWTSKQGGSPARGDWVLTLCVKVQ